MKTAQIGIVVIGRNEGPLLTQCLRSVCGLGYPVVYVDSGSEDGSPEHAREFTKLVHQLSADTPFSAARARNEGFELLVKQHSELKYVQFVDGDCELKSGWFEDALDALERDQNVAALSGHLREKFSTKNIYHSLISFEWDSPIGEATDCGGIALFRTDAFEEVGGFNKNIRAGEEPELCLRLARAGYTIRKIDSEMGVHDADINGISGIISRVRMSGYAFMTGFMLHGSILGGYRHREVLRIILWALALPLSIGIFSIFISKWALLLTIAYPLQICRITYTMKRGKNLNTRLALSYGAMIVLGKFYELRGALQAIRDFKR